MAVVALSSAASATANDCVSQMNGETDEKNYAHCEGTVAMGLAGAEHAVGVHHARENISTKVDGSPSRPRPKDHVGGPNYKVVGMTLAVVTKELLRALAQVSVLCYLSLPIDCVFWIAELTGSIPFRCLDGDGYEVLHKKEYNRGDVDIDCIHIHTLAYARRCNGSLE